MTRKLLALAAGTLAVLLISSTFDAADAKSRGGWSGGGGKFYGGGGGYGRPFGGARFYGGGSYRAYSFAGPRVHRPPPLPQRLRGRRAARRLRRLLLRQRLRVAAPQGHTITGSGYWWNRYYACLDGYY